MIDKNQAQLGTLLQTTLLRRLEARHMVYKYITTIIMHGFCIYSWFLYALPKVNMPKVEMMLSTTGTGFLRRIARGIAEPPRTMEASKLSSTP